MTESATAVQSAPSASALPAESTVQELPFVSVIIPVRNDAERLARCLDSLVKQNYPADRFEIIVIDNGSTDASAAVAKSRGATVLCHPGLRVGALRNRGVQVAQGTILAFVDSDHEVPADWLLKAVEGLASDREVLMIGSPYLAPSNGTWVQKTWELHRTRGPSRRRVEWLGSGNMFVRRTDFQQVAGFDENLVAAEDVDLCVRMARLPGRIVSDMNVANIHHGEPRTLRDFIAKEYWRGSSGIRAFLSHGMPFHELPSLLFPLYHLLGLFAIGTLTAWAAWSGTWWWPVLAFLALIMPSLMLGLKTCWQEGRCIVLPALTLLYFVYGLVRALALFKR